MPGHYDDPTFNNRQMVPAAFAVDFGTATASGTNALADAVATLPKFIRRTKVNNVRVRCTVAPAANSDSFTAILLNGTDTAGSVVFGTATLDQWLDFTMTAANQIFAADVQPTITLDGTSTASGQAIGDFDIYFEQAEQYA